MQLVQKHYEYELQKAEENYQCEMEQTTQAYEAEVQECPIRHRYTSCMRGPARTKEMEEQSQIISDQDRTIEELNKRITDLELKIEERKEELHRITLEKGKKVAEDEMRESRQKMEIEQLKKTIQEDKDMFSKITAEMEQDERKDQEIIFDLKRKIKVKKKDLEIERQKTKSANILLERMKYDLHKCSHCIQDPKKLKENLIKRHRRYIYEADVTISPADEILRYYHRQIDHFQKVQKTQKETHTRNMKLEKNRASRIERVPAILKKSIGAVVLHAGTNDIRLRQTEILKKDFRSLVEKVRTTSPTTRIIVSGPLPTFQRGIE
ncbi:hypothetical protein QTP70_015908, partial [Hemibagrus guttatus]